MAEQKKADLAADTLAADEDPEAELKIRLATLALKEARIGCLRDHVTAAARAAMDHLLAAREAQLSSYAVQANATQRDQLLKKLQADVQASVLHHERLLRDRIDATVVAFEQEKKEKLERGDSITIAATTSAIVEKPKHKEKDHATRLLKDTHPDLSNADILAFSTSMKSVDTDGDDDDDDDDDDDGNNDVSVVVEEGHAHVRFVEGTATGLDTHPPHSARSSNSGSHSPFSGAFSPRHNPQDKNLGYDRKKGSEIPEWIQFTEPASGNPYWVNTVNGDTVVENPLSHKNSV